MEEIIRQPLPVPGAWAYGWDEGVLCFVFDECFTEDEIAEHVESVKSTLPLTEDGRTPSS